MSQIRVFTAATLAITLLLSNGAMAFAQTSQATLPTQASTTATPKAEEKSDLELAEAAGMSQLITFSDVPTEGKYARAVSFVVEKGYMPAIPQGRFNLEGKIRRIDAVTALMRALKPTGESLMQAQPTQSPFRDVSKKNPALPIIQEAHEDDVLDLYTFKRNYFKPNATVSGGEALHMFYKAVNVDPTATPITLRYEIKENALPPDYLYGADVRKAVAETVMLQKSDSSLFLDPTQPLSRGDFALLLYRFKQSRTDGTAFGLASWYGDGLSKVLPPNETGKALKAKYMTCASRYLPMGTILTVTNELNGKTVTVVVNDRGPYIAGRIVDLSRSAFAAIENPGAGTAVVKIELAPQQ